MLITENVNLIELNAVRNITNIVMLCYICKLFSVIQFFVEHKQHFVYSMVVLKKHT